jgi:hypothetical protein
MAILLKYGYAAYYVPSTVRHVKEDSLHFYDSLWSSADLANGSTCYEVFITTSKKQHLH